MKFWKKTIAAFLCVLLLMACAVPALAAERSTVKEAIDNGMRFYLEVEKPLFASHNLQPDLWHLLLKNHYDGGGDFSFLTPQVVNTTEGASATDCAKHMIQNMLLGDENAARTQFAGMFALVNQQGVYQFPTAQSAIWSIIAVSFCNELGMKLDFDINAAVNALIAMKKSDGGYNDYGDTGNVDTTGMALLALTFAQAPQSEKDSAASFIINTQEANGYFLGKGQYDCENSCTQAWGIIGLLALYDDKYESNVNSAVDAMLRCQDANGGFWYQETKTANGWSVAPDDMSTYESLLALFAYKNMLSEKQSDTVSVVSQDDSVAIVTPASAVSVTAANNNPSTGDNSNVGLVWGIVAAAAVLFVVVIVISVVQKKKNSSSDEQHQDPSDPTDRKN